MTDDRQKAEVLRNHFASWHPSVEEIRMRNKNVITNTDCESPVRVTLVKDVDVPSSPCAILASARFESHSVLLWSRIRTQG